MSYSTLGAQVWHVLTRDHTCLAATHMFIHECRMNHICLNLPEPTYPQYTNRNLRTKKFCKISTCARPRIYYISRESLTTRNVLWSRAFVCVCVCLSVCLSVCLRVCLSAAACLHYCTDPDVIWGSCRDAP